MDFKNIFKKDDAVSPVIGVVLMVAITVILAAAIGSSVFGQGPAESAPQANINVKFTNYTSSNIPANITVEHLGGETLDFNSSSIKLYDDDGSAIGLDVDAFDDSDHYFAVGEVVSININTSLSSNSQYNVKIVDTVSGNLICNKNLRT